MEKGLDGGCVRVPHVYVVHMYVMWTEDDLTTANQRSRLAATVTEDAPSPGVRAVESATFRRGRTKCTQSRKAGTIKLPEIIVAK